MADGRMVVAVRIPQYAPPSVQGFYARKQGERLDLLAHHFLADATAFHRLCDANGTIAPDALGARSLIAIPVKER
jgi:hypothetical protein